MLTTQTRNRVMSIVITAAVMSSPAFAQDCEVKLGAVGPLSGAAAAWGLAAKDGAEFAAALVNKEGGLPLGDEKCQVKVVSFDSQYTAAGGSAGANFLESNGIHATVGPVGSPETTGFRPVAARSGIVNFSPSYMRDVITPEFPLAFHALQAPITWGPILIPRAKEQFGFDSVMVIAPNDQGGTDASGVLAKMYTEAGAKATEEYYQRGTTDFSPLATRIMRQNPGAVEVSTVPPGDTAILVKQLLEAGYDGTIGSLGGGGLAPIVEGAGSIEDLTNVYWLEVSPSDAPQILKMKEDFKQLMGRDAPVNPLFPVLAISAEVILDGISKAGTDQDGEKIAEALRGMTPKSRYMGEAGWRGKTEYGINQEVTFPPGLGMIVDGEKQPTAIIEIPSE
ncbi:ABC transporter substrate-binding protein [Paracoccus sp. J39]|uniref:ABC transporter substrate-binding protein n=1 Tax=Paracoccus sp. J39 TaxID=935848 RepID=UPI000A01E907|nr:ABC transporter substrate-binding protein [Paracoccus sp. J39]